MDTTGYYPQLGDDDPLFEIAEYTQLMKDQLVVKTANCTLSSGNTAYDSVPTTVTRQGVMVSFNGRVTRSAQYNVATVPVGYRPDRNVFFSGIHAGNHVLIQISSSGVVTTPFNTSSGDLMMNVTYAIPTTSPLPA